MANITAYVERIYKLLNFTNSVDNEDPDYIFIEGKLRKVGQDKLKNIYEEMVDLSTKSDIKTGASRRDFNLIIEKYVTMEMDELWNEYGLQEQLEFIPPMLHNVFWHLRETGMDAGECAKKMSDRGFMESVKYDNKFIQKKTLDLFDLVDKEKCIDDLWVKGIAFIRDYHILPAFKSMITKIILNKSDSNNAKLENKERRELIVSGEKKSLSIPVPRF
jgi:hypothetical protein